MKQWFVYILASDRNGALYIGVTNNLARRGDEHRSKDSKDFTEKYSVHKLVYHEAYDNPQEAIVREKNMKACKLWLIESTNPQ